MERVQKNAIGSCFRSPEETSEYKTPVNFLFTGVLYLRVIHRKKTDIYYSISFATGVPFIPSETKWAAKREKSLMFFSTLAFSRAAIYILRS